MSSRCVPEATTRPPSMSATRSARAIVESRWAMINVVRPRTSRCSASWICNSILTSMALVASSRMRICGFSRMVRAMPAGERVAALADDSVVPVLQPDDELVGVGGPGRRHDLVAGRVEPAVGDVVVDRRREEERLVEADADVRPQAGDAEVADVG